MNTKFHVRYCLQFDDNKIISQILRSYIFVDFCGFLGGGVVVVVLYSPNNRQ